MLVTALAAFSQGCIFSNDTDERVFGKGTVRRIDLPAPPGFFGIVGDDGRNYEPTNLEQPFRVCGMRILFSGRVREDLGSARLWGRVIDLDTVRDASGNDTIRPPCGGVRSLDGSPAWSPDGRTIAYYHRGMGSERSGIYTIRLGDDLRPETPELLLAHDGGVGDLRFSPTGAQLVYWFGGNIWILDVASGEDKQLTFMGNTSDPDWHPNGEQLVYSRVFESPSEEDPGGIRVLDIQTGEDWPVRRRGGGVIYGGHPRWHPDGASIVFFFGDWTVGNRSTEIFRVFPDSSDYVFVTKLGWQALDPRWYDEGRSVVFNATVGGKGETFIVDADGANPRRFPNDALPAGYLGSAFDVSPDESMVVVVEPDAWEQFYVLWVVDLTVADQLRRRQITLPP